MSLERCLRASQRSKSPLWPAGKPPGAQKLRSKWLFKESRTCAALLCFSFLCSKTRNNVVCATLLCLSLLCSKTRKIFVRSGFSKNVEPAPLCSVSLCSALLCSVHGDRAHVRCNARRCCSKMLDSVAPHSASLHSVLFAPMHGYARGHTSISL